MKKRLTRNIGVKILSVILAALLWLLITNVDDPVKTQLFPNIPVTVLNEQVVDSPNHQYEIVEGETITFRVAARRSILEELSKDDFKVTADFAKLLNGNTVMIDIAPKRFANEVSITDGKYQTLTIKLDEVIYEDFKVNVVPVGNVADGYHIAEKFASPNIIRVTGPKGRIDKINEVVAEVNVEGVNSSFFDISMPKALDEEGKEIDSSKLSFSNRYPEVNIKLYKTKTVDLKILTEGQPANGFMMTGIDYEPKTVTIAAEDDVLRDISYLEVTQSIEGASSNIESDIDLRDELMLKKGVILVEDNTTISINIKMEQLESKEITIWPNDIEIRNREESLLPTLNTVGPIRVKVIGLGNEVDTLSRITLESYIDITDYSIGTYVLPLKAVLPQNTVLYEAPMISVSLTP